MADEYPYQSHSFMVEFAGITASFLEVDGLVQTIKFLEIEECTDPFQTTTIPLRHSFSNLILKRGKTSDKGMLDWWNQTKGQSKTTSPDFRKSGQLHLLRNLRTKSGIVATWTIRNAWLVRFEQSPLNAKESGLAIETVELAHEGIQEVDAGKAR